MDSRCTICDLDQTHRKIGEVLLREKVALDAVVPLVNCWAEKNNLPRTGRSSWARHRQNGHFLLDTSKPVKDDGKTLSVDEMVDTLWDKYQSTRKSGAAPSTKEMFEILSMRAKLRADLERAEEEKKQRELLMGAAPE